MVCSGCGSELAARRLSCPACHRLVHRDELERLRSEAEAARQSESARGEIVAWRRALELLPPDSEQFRAIQGRVSALSRAIEETPDVEGEPAREGRGGKRWRWAGVGGLALLGWKAKSLLLLLATKGKFLIAGLTKSSTFLSMFLSLGVYWAAFGWRFALGLVLSIYVHEMGHVAALARLGLRASAPMFLPGIGAVVRLDQYPVDAREDARVGLAGPVWGLGAAIAAYGVFVATEAPIWGAIAHVGAWINLFNLLPVWQLDGSRGFRALSRAQGVVVTLLAGGLYLWTREGMLLLLGLVAAWRSWNAEEDLVGDSTAFAQFGVLLVALSALMLVDVGI